MSSETNQTPPPPPAPQEGATLGRGRYILGRRLADGGTASVYLGYDRDASQWRAIKVLLPEYARRPGLRHRFETEARTMSGLEHPNVIRVFDAGQEGEAAWMVMEFAEGGSVVDWIDRHGPMPPRLACKVILELCEGIASAHERGVVHRDVKPQNVLIDGHGVVKVTDFGIAQVLEENRVTMTGMVMGTFGFMAPEQHESAKHADHRADVYSIAATLYTLLAGEAPTHLFMADKRDLAVIPAPLVEVVKKASQFKREARYEDVRSMAAALREAMEALPLDPPWTPPLVSPEALRLDQLPAPTPGGEFRYPEPASKATPMGGDAHRAAPLPRDPGATPPAAPARSPMGAARASTPDPAPEPARAAPLPPPARDDPRSKATPRPVIARNVRAELDRRDRLRKGVQWAALSMAVLGALLAALVGWGAWRVAQWEAIVDGSEFLLYEQIHEERTLLDVLGPLEIPQVAELRPLFDEVDQGDPEHKEAAARRLVATLEQIRRAMEARASTREEHAVKQLNESLRHLQERIEEQERMRESLARVRSSGTGGLATSLGF